MKNLMKAFLFAVAIVFVGFNSQSSLGQASNNEKTTVVGYLQQSDDGAYFILKADLSIVMLSNFPAQASVRLGQIVAARGIVSSSDEVLTMDASALEGLISFGTSVGMRVGGTDSTSLVGVLVEEDGGLAILTENWGQVTLADVPANAVEFVGQTVVVRGTVIDEESRTVAVEVLEGIQHYYPSSENCGSRLGGI